MLAASFSIALGDHPIVPVMLGDAVLALKMSQKLLDKAIIVCTEV